MKKSLEKFLKYLTFQRHYSLYTIKNYEIDINNFIIYLNFKHIDGLQIEYSSIKAYLTYLDKLNLSKNSVSRHISSLKSFYRFLLKNNIITNNPFSLVHLPKKDKKLPKFLYSNEIDEIFTVFNLDKPLDQRNRLVFEVLYATGIRVSELVNIKIEDIDFNNKTIKVLGKGNKERIVNYGEYAQKILKLYLNNGYKMLNKDNSNYLFLNNRGGVLTDRGVRLIVDEAIKKTSIQTKISPHVIRHTFATHMLNEGCDIQIVQELLGHESLRATQVYTHITNDHLKEVYLKCLPRNKDSI